MPLQNTLTYDIVSPSSSCQEQHSVSALGRQAIARHTVQTNRRKLKPFFSYNQFHMLDHFAREGLRQLTHSGCLFPTSISTLLYGNCVTFLAARLSATCNLLPVCDGSWIDSRLRLLCMGMRIARTTTIITYQYRVSRGIGKASAKHLGEGVHKL